ncbi:MAG: phytoene desaturase family protein [Sarcina sp.]
MEYDVIVIGSGIGGLTTAATLAKQGYRVLVLEKHFLAGGYATNFKRKGFNFDVSLQGIAGLEEDGSLNKIFSFCDVKSKIIPLKSETVFSTYVDNKLLKLPNEYNLYKQFYLERFQENKEEIERLFKDIKKFADGFNRLILEKNKSFTNKIHINTLLFIKWSNKTTYEVLQEYTKNEEFIKLFTTMWTYYGLPPKELAAIYFFIPWISYHMHGKYYIRGGAQELSNAFVSTIEEKGGMIKLNSKVTEIVCKDKEVIGVKTAKGEFFQSKFIVANTSPKNIMNLLEENLFTQKELKKFDDYVVGCTLSQLYIGLDCEPKVIGIEDDEVFFVANTSHEEDYNLALNNKYEESGFLLTNYNSIDTSLNDKNKGVVTITYIDNYNYWSDEHLVYKKQKDEVIEKIIKRLEKYYPSIREHIKVLEFGTPKTMERYTGNDKGAVYGYA